VKKTLATITQEIDSTPGQGNFLEQINKMLRKKQRGALFDMFRELDNKGIKLPEVILYKNIPQTEKQYPARLRFKLPDWENNHHDVFWKSLVYYTELAVHRVTNNSYDKNGGTLMIEYFQKDQGHKREPEDVLEIIKKNSYLVDNEILPTDYTRFRLMAEHSDTVGEMSPTQAALVGLLLKII
jgi:hypothetical protein